MDLGLMAASGHPSEATIDDIMRDAYACANAGITGVGNMVKTGINMYNTMGNIFSGQAQQNTNPYSANMGMYQAAPQAQYAYAESGVGYGTAYINPMTSQMPMGYPGFADPDYGMGSSMGYSGFGGNL